MNNPLMGLAELGDIYEFASELDRAQQFEIDGRHWCPNCKRENRFSTSVSKATINLKFANRLPQPKAYGNISGFDGSWENIAVKLDRFQGSLFSIQCANCKNSGRILVQKIAEKISLLVFFDQGNSIATVNTPDPVKYYLEQANACHTVKAFSATLAMYRTALDAILYGEGFREGMVGTKIAKLKTAIEAGTAPDWSRDLKTEYLTIINQLGNSSLHISAEDIQSERSIDTSDIKEVEVVMEKLLYVIYEKSKDEENTIKRLNEFKVRKKG